MPKSRNSMATSALKLPSRPASPSMAEKHNITRAFPNFNRKFPAKSCYSSSSHQADKTTMCSRNLGGSFLQNYTAHVSVINGRRREHRKRACRFFFLALPPGTGFGYIFQNNFGHMAKLDLSLTYKKSFAISL